MKKILMVSDSHGHRVNPDLCPHEHTVTIKTGYEYTIAGEHMDNTDCYEQCLLCGYVKRGDGTWGKVQDEITDKIPF